MNVDQKRAKFALRKVEQAKQALQKYKDFVNAAKASSALVMSNGLMASLAFWQSRSEEHVRILVPMVLEWLKEQNLTGNSEYAGSMKEITEMSSLKYMQATQEALEFLKWLRQLAAAAE